ncbi:hypothetical protein LIER_07588 [Lithospermum erythrorhizon]|uniref:Uncharacterized protein n=1 Tax=Lithospermum erythrorhizon TaxID=34254 RepID=A0AAV3PD08_LITER
MATSFDYHLDIPAFLMFPADYANFRPATLRLPGWNVKGLGFQPSWKLNGQLILRGLTRLHAGQSASNSLS